MRAFLPVSTRMGIKTVAKQQGDTVSDWQALIMSRVFMSEVSESSIRPA